MKIIIPVFCFVALAGCASPQLMNIQDLKTFKIDCNQKEEQITFLKSQILTKDQKIGAYIGRSMLGEFQAAMRGEKSQGQSIMNGEYDVVAKDKIRRLKENCPNKTVYDYEDICQYGGGGKLICMHDLNGNSECDKCPKFRY